MHHLGGRAGKDLGHRGVAPGDFAGIAEQPPGQGDGAGSGQGGDQIGQPVAAGVMLTNSSMSSAISQSVWRTGLTLPASFSPVNWIPA